MNIDHNSSIPLHQQAENLLRSLIEKEEYQNGKLLPKETELAEQLKISRNTLRQAINKLVFEGLLVRKKGYGTKVVKSNMMVGVKNWLSFSQEMSQLGIKVINYELHISRQVPTSEISNFFGIKEGMRCMKLERLRGDEEHPFVYFVSYFNPEIPLTGEENFNRPLYELLEKDFGVAVKTSKEGISASLAGEKIAEKLEIKATDPILIRKRCVYDVNGKPVEHNVGYYRADRFTYFIEAER